MGLFKSIRNLDLGTKLNVVVVLALVILLATIAAVMGMSIGNLTTQTGRQRVEQETKVVQSRFEEAGQEVLASTKLLASRPGLVEAVANRDAAGVRMAALVGAAPLDLDDIDVVDSNGAYITTMLETGEIARAAQEDALLSLALLGIETTGVIIEEEVPDLRLAAAVYLRDASGAIVGAALASREVDDEFLEEINFSREDVHLALIAGERILAQDFPTQERLEEFSAVLLEKTTLGQALGGQALVADDLVRSADGVPYALAYTPLTVRGDTHATIGILVDLGELSIFQGQLTTNTAVMFTFLSLMTVIAVALFVQRSVTVPIGRLQSVAERMASGDYQQRAEVMATDEIGQLANAFNAMASQLQDLINSLEQRVADRTRALERRSDYLVAAADVVRASAYVLDDPQALLSQVVTLISKRFGFYHAGLFLLDPSGEWAVLQAASSEGGQRMLAREHRLRVGTQGIVGYVTARGKHRIALDVGADPVFFDNPDLPNTRSEIALPLRTRGQVIGALDVQSAEMAAFDEDDALALQTLADQVAMTISNARLFQQLQAAMEAERRAYGEISREAWAELLRARADWGYSYEYKSIVPAEGAWRSEMLQAAQTGRSVQGDGAGNPTLSVPLKVRDHVVGVLDFQKDETGELWTADEVALLETLAEQLGLALESARLHQDTQRRATREQLTGEVTARIRETLDMETVLKTAVQEVRQALGLPEVVIRLATSPADKAQNSVEQSEA